MEDISIGNQAFEVIIITEANEKVASGHLMESIELAGLLNSRGKQSLLLINDNAPIGLKKKIVNRFHEYPKDVNSGYLEIVGFAKRCQSKLIITDLREVGNDWITKMKKELAIPIVCIDEFGNRRLDCDVVINPMVDHKFWIYEGSKCKIYAGGQYLILPPKIRKYHSRKKEINETIQRVCIAMGGVDYYNTTQKIIEFLPRTFPDFKWDIVVGAGYRNFNSLGDAIEKTKSKIIIHQNIDYIYDLFFEADLAFCAGGNTLHEIACIGTPSIVIPSMKHEVYNGKYFEEAGCCICLKQSENVKKEEIVESANRIKERGIRRKMSFRGKRCCLGDGGLLTVNIIEELLK